MTSWLYLKLPQDAYTPREVSPMESLPLEVLLSISQYLHPSALCSVVNTCRALYSKLQPSLYHTVGPTTITTTTDKQPHHFNLKADKYSSPDIEGLFQSACLRNELSKFSWVRVLGVTQGLLCAATPINDYHPMDINQDAKQPLSVAFQQALPYMTNVHTLRVSVDSSLENIRLDECVDAFRHVVSNLPSLRSIEVSAQLFSFLPAICATEEVKSGLITSINVILNWGDSNSGDIDQFYNVLEEHAESLRSLQITFPYEDSDYWPDELEESRLPLEKLQSIEIHGGLFIVPSNIVNYTHLDCAPPPVEFEELASKTTLQKLKIQSSFQYSQESFTKTYIPADINFHNLTVLELYDPRSSEWLGHDPVDVQLLPRGYLHSVVVANQYLCEVTCPSISDETLRVLAEPARAQCLEELYIHFPHSGDIEAPYTTAGITALSACSRLRTLRFNIGNVRLCPELLEPLVKGNDRLEKILVFHGFYQKEVAQAYPGDTEDILEQRREIAAKAVSEAMFADIFVPGCNNGEWPPKGERSHWITAMESHADERDNGVNGYIINVAKLKAEMKWTL